MVGNLFFSKRIQRQIQFQNIHTRFTEKTEVSGIGIGADNLQYFSVIFLEWIARPGRNDEKGKTVATPGFYIRGYCGIDKIEKIFELRHIHDIILL